MKNKRRFLSTPQGLGSFTSTLLLFACSLLFLILAFVDVLLHRDGNVYNGDYPPYLSLFLLFGALSILSLIVLIVLLILFKKKRKNDHFPSAEPAVALSAEVAKNLSQTPKEPVSILDGQEEAPRFEMKDYALPLRFSYLFHQVYDPFPFFPCLIGSIPFVFLALALVNLFVWKVDYLCLAFFSEAGVMGLFALFALLFVPLLSKRRLVGMKGMTLRFYEDRLEVSHLVHERSAYLGEAKIVVPYTGVFSKNNLSKYLFLYFFYKGRRSAFGIEKRQMPEGLENFLLAKLSQKRS